MSSYRFFIDRRTGYDRRLDRDPCKYMPLDLYHRKRRKSTDRRAADRTLADDCQAFLGDTLQQTQPDPADHH